MYETIDSAFGNYYQWNPPIPLLNALFSEKFYDASHRKEGKRLKESQKVRKTFRQIDR